MSNKNIFTKVLTYLKELGKLTPLAFATAVLPIVISTSLLALALPVGHWLRENREIGAILFFTGIVVLCGLSLLPTNVIGIVGGWAFGFALGAPLLMGGIVCAATVSFLINLRIAGNTLPQVFEKHPKAQAICKALVGQDIRRTALTIFLLRLSPAMPFALTNFLMASARVPLPAFIAGTFFGMLPRSLAVVVVGSGLSELSFNDPQESWLIVFGIIATGVSAIFISYVAKHALNRLTRENHLPGDNST